MENLRPKIKLKAVFKSKATENGQLGVTSESLPGYMVSNTTSEHGNGSFPILTGRFKRKQAQRHGYRREEQKYETSPAKLFHVPSDHVEEEDFSDYNNSEDREEGEEDLRTGNGTHCLLDCYNAASKLEEVRNTERVQYRQGSLRVKFKPSKFRKISSNCMENQRTYIDDGNNSVSAFSAQKDQSPYVESRSEYYNLSSTPDMHAARSEWFAAKLGSSQQKPLRSVVRLSTPRKMRSDRSSERSSSPQQSEHVESVWKSENQRIKALAIPEGRLKKDGRDFFPAEKGGGFMSQSVKEELEAALMVLKKIMKMEAAEPFNTPVDPVSLGIPDYFDVIDMPMDLGTICNALQKGKKYKTSKDVFHDVQLVWDNCVKYNHKGDPILELMKRVKKNFTKYWTAAGLYYESAKRSGCIPLSGKVNSLSNIEDGDRMTEYEHTCLAADISDKNINESKTEKVINIPEVSQNVNTNTGNMDIQRSPQHDAFEKMEMPRSSDDSGYQRSQMDDMIKKKGIKFVIKNPMSVQFSEENTSIGRNAIPECISVDLENSHKGMDDEFGPKLVDSDTFSPEGTQQKDLGFKMRSHRWQRSHRHRSGCLCAVCVATRRKLARKENAPLVNIQSTRINENASHTLKEQPLKIEEGREMDKAQEPKEVDGCIERLEERSAKEVLEAHKDKERLQEKKGQIGEDLEKESSGKYFSADINFPLQNTSPSISKMGMVLFGTWNWPHSLTYRPPRQCADNPIMDVISSFTD
ncbi:uncharacterized protein LOC131064461 isoform X3 [Cryptomeria japonica]|uniref:uncharacterized protein LOC131064461 isoform X3 n=1 Tax=Cryptomeria japonica TaxID=3369 RepID=UPI0027D9E015|nr:uncharacterized protein LOC131064461 isoform X3 [Cryptomeria japonica]